MKKRIVLGAVVFVVLLLAALIFMVKCDDEGALDEISGAVESSDAESGAESFESISFSEDKSSVEETSAEVLVESSDVPESSNTESETPSVSKSPTVSEPHSEPVKPPETPAENSKVENTPQPTEPVPPVANPDPPVANPVLDNWDFKEGVTYETILKPYAESLGYVCKYYSEITVSGNTRYNMEFTKDGNMVYANAKTVANAAYLIEGGTTEVWPYRVMCGTEERVDYLRNTYIFVADGLFDKIYTSDFIKEKLLEWS